MSTHQFKHPFSCIIAGPSQCGKTTFVERLIKHQDQMIHLVPKAIIWHYPEFQPAYLCLMDKVTFNQGIPTDEQLKTCSGKSLIIDDLMSEMGDSFKQFVHEIRSLS